MFRSETPKALQHFGGIPRYYLHVCDGAAFVEDEEGLELPNEEAARQKAIEGLRDIMAAEMRSGALNMASFIEIEDGNGLVMTVQFLDAVDITTVHSNRR